MCNHLCLTQLAAQISHFAHKKNVVLNALTSSGNCIVPQIDVCMYINTCNYCSLPAPTLHISSSVHPYILCSTSDNGASLHGEVSRQQRHAQDRVLCRAIHSLRAICAHAANAECSTVDDCIVHPHKQPVGPCMHPVTQRLSALTALQYTPGLLTSACALKAPDVDIRPRMQIHSVM